MTAGEAAGAKDSDLALERKRNTRTYEIFNEKKRRLQGLAV